MNVGDLIDKLAEFPRDTRVLVSGYEDGYDEPVVKQANAVDKGPETKEGSWWSGRWEDPWYGEKGQVEQVVVVAR